MRQEDAPVTDTKVGRPSKPYVIPHDLAARPAQAAQVRIAGNDDPIFLRNRRRPCWRPGDVVNTLRQFRIVERGLRPIETRELSELFDAAAHDETVLHEALLLQRARRIVAQ